VFFRALAQAATMAMVWPLLSPRTPLKAMLSKL
jgi:hypothetical protein